GTLKVTNAGALGTSAGATLVAAGATLELSNVNVTSELMNINGTGANATDGAVHVTTASTWGGNILLNTNSTIKCDAALLASGQITNTSAGNLTVTGSSALTLSGDNS